VIVSVSWSSPFARCPAVTVRSTDWEIHGWRKYLHYLSEAWHLHRSAEDVLLITASSEVIFLSALSVFGRRRLVVYDFLMPRNRVVRRIARLVLWRVDAWIVVRRGDVHTLVGDFGVARSRCRFVPFPAQPAGVEARLGDYIYAAGTAYRDWPTFLSAAEQLGRAVIISSHPPLQTAVVNVEARALVTPAEGRVLSARARLVVVPMLETDLPSGPLIVVDAMAAGKAVVASDVNGTRDYIRHGVNGWLVPPNDAAGLASQIAAVIDDEAELLRIGAAAARAHLSVQECLDQVVSAAQR
jgi:hypothetical protein